MALGSLSNSIINESGGVDCNGDRSGSGSGSHRRRCCVGTSVIMELIPIHCNFSWHTQLKYYFLIVRLMAVIDVKVE